jgi:hypothetical protein
MPLSIIEGLSSYFAQNLQAVVVRQNFRMQIISNCGTQCSATATTMAPASPIAGLLSVWVGHHGHGSMLIIAYVYNIVVR